MKTEQILQQLISGQTIKSIDFVAKIGGEKITDRQLETLITKGFIKGSKIGIHHYEYNLTELVKQLNATEK